MQTISRGRGSETLPGRRANVRGQRKKTVEGHKAAVERGAKEKQKVCKCHEVGVNVKRFPEMVARLNCPCTKTLPTLTETGGKR